MLILQQTICVNFRNCAKKVFTGFRIIINLFFSRGKSKCLESQQSRRGFHSTITFFFNYASHTSNIGVIIVPLHVYKNIGYFVICADFKLDGTNDTKLGNKSVNEICVSCVKERIILTEIK